MSATEGIDLNSADNKGALTLVFIYSGDYAERVIRNFVNDPSFCKSCGLYCDFCKYDVYSNVHNIRAAIELAEPPKLPAFVEDPEEYMPKKIPNAVITAPTGIPTSGEI